MGIGVCYAPKRVTEKACPVPYGMASGAALMLSRKNQTVWNCQQGQPHTVWLVP